MFTSVWRITGTELEMDAMTETHRSLYNAPHVPSAVIVSAEEDTLLLFSR